MRTATTTTHTKQSKANTQSKHTRKQRHNLFYTIEWTRTLYEYYTMVYSKGKHILTSSVPVWIALSSCIPMVQLSSECRCLSSSKRPKVLYSFVYSTKSSLVELVGWSVGRSVDGSLCSVWSVFIIDTPPKKTPDEYCITQPLSFIGTSIFLSMYMYILLSHMQRFAFTPCLHYYFFVYYR